MNFRYLPLLFFIFLFISCNSETKEKSIKQNAGQVAKDVKHTVGILPFKDIDSTLIQELKDRLQKQLPVEISVLNTIPIPASAYYKPRQRYIADNLLVFLKEINQGRFEKIIGVTTKDISTRKGDVVNWGILGLGTCPGEACVISSFRAGRNKVINDIFIKRMTTLALHELGHTYGLEHCPSETCLMKDAKGKMNLDDGDYYCNKCRGYLLEMSILK